MHVRRNLEWGKQYRVAPGETIQVERLEGKVGDELVFADVLAVKTDDAKMIAGKDAGKTKVTGKIVAHGKHAKRVVLKFKRGGQYKITRGHRQGYTSVQVGEINLG